MKGSQRNSHGRALAIAKNFAVMRETYRCHCIIVFGERKKKAAYYRRIIPQPRPSGPAHGRFPPFLVFFIYVEVTVLG